jgi:hypothetical protein
MIEIVVFIGARDKVPVNPAPMTKLQARKLSKDPLNQFHGDPASWPDVAEYERTTKSVIRGRRNIARLQKCV